MENSYLLKHETIPLLSTFEVFTANLENRAGKFDYSIFDDKNADPEWVKAEITKMEGEQNLMIFSINDHGKVLALFSEHKKVIQYNIGNPLIAASMTSHDIRAANYAPLRVLVYEDIDGATYVDYELPSVIFGQFSAACIKKVGSTLDRKLKKLIELTDKDASQ